MNKGFQKQKKQIDSLKDQYKRETNRLNRVLRAIFLSKDRSHSCGRGEGALDNIEAFYPIVEYKNES